MSSILTTENPLDSGLDSATPMGTTRPIDIGAPETAVGHALRTNAVGVTADRAAKQVRQSRDTGIPEEVMMNDDTPAIQQALRDQQFDSFLRAVQDKDNWALAKVAAMKPQWAAIGQERLDELQGIQRFTKASTARWRQAWDQIELQQLNARRVRGDILDPDEEDRRLSLRQSVEITGQAGAVTRGEKVLTGLQSLGPQYLYGAETAAKFAVGGAVTGAIATRGAGGWLGAAGGAVRGAALAAKIGFGYSAGEQEAGAALEEFEALTDETGRPMDKGAARLAALAVGGINGMLEVAQLDILLKSLPGTDELIQKFGAKQAAKMALQRPSVRRKLTELAIKYPGILAGEVGIEAAQKAVTTMFGEGLAKTLSDQQFAPMDMGKKASEVAQEAHDALFTMIPLPLPGAAVSVMVEAASAKHYADQQEQVAKAFGERIAKAKTTQDAPDLVGELAEQSDKAEGGEGKVYVSYKGWSTYFQGQGINPDAAAEVAGATPEQVAEAKAADGKIELPLSGYVSRVAGTEHHAGLTGDIAFAHDELTANELRDAVEQALEQDKAAREITETARTDEYRQVYEDIRGQLLGIGRSQKAAESEATLMASGFEAAARISGKSIQELRDAGFEPVIQRQVNDLLLKKEGVTYTQSEIDDAYQMAGELLDQDELPPDLAADRKIKRWWTDYQKLTSVSDAGRSDGMSNKTRDKMDDIYTGLVEHLKNYVKKRETRNADGSITVTRNDAVLRQDNRGSIQFTGSEAIISLLENADQSTFLHETGHLFFEMLRWAVAQSDATPEAQQHMATLLKWYKVESADQVTEKHHEQFADGFLTYLREGKAPSARLQDIFKTFGAWLRRLYQSLTINGVRLNDDVRKVMDAMVEADQEALAAEREAGYDNLIFALQHAGVSELDLAVLKERIASAHEELVQDLTQKTLEHRERSHKKWWQEQRKRVEADVRQETMKNKVYRALSFLTTGKLPDGLPLERFPSKADAGREGDINAVKWMKFDPAVIERLYGKESETYQALKKLGVLQQSKKDLWDNVSPGLIAHMFGMGSADELVQSILTARPMEDTIQAATDAEMERLFPDEQRDVALAAESRANVLSRQSAEVIGKVLSMVKKLQNDDLLKAREKATTEGLKLATRPTLTVKALREIARGIVGKRTMATLKPAQYRIAGDKHLRQALAHIRKREWADAIVTLELSMINRALFTEAIKQRDWARKEVHGWRRMARRKYLDRLGKSAGAGWAEMLEHTFHAIGIRTLKPERLAQLRSFQDIWEQKIRNGETVHDYEVPPAVSMFLRRVIANPVDFSAMTLDQMHEIAGDIEEFKTLAGHVGKTYRVEKGSKITDLVDQSVESITRFGGEAKPVNPEETTGWWSKYFGWQRAFLTTLTIMDGGKDNGVLYRLLGAGNIDAANRTAVMREQWSDRYVKLSELYTLKERWDFNVQKMVPGTTYSLSRGARLMIALHAGSELNRAHLLEAGIHPDKPFTESDLQKVLDSLNEKDVEFIKGVWQINAELFALVQEHDRRVRGRAPVPKKLSPVVTRFGVLDGGYMPISENPRTGTPRHMNEEAIARAIMTGAVSGTMPSDSFTKTAVEGAKHSPLRIDLGLVSSHINEVVHYLTWYEYLADAYRIVGSAKFAATVRRHYGDEFYRSMVHHLNTMAHGDIAQADTSERIADLVSGSSSVAMIGFNAMTMAMQWTGIFNSWSRLGGLGDGTKWIATGLNQMLTSPLDDTLSVPTVIEKIRTESALMRTRAHSQAVEQERISAQLMSNVGQGRVQAAMSEYRRRTVMLSFWGIVKMQVPVDIVTYLAAKTKAMASSEIGGLGMSEHDAILYAEGIVTSAQGSGRLADLPAMLQKRGWVRLVTALMTFFNATLNQWMIHSHNLKRAGFKGFPQFLNHSLLLLMFPAIGAGITKMVLRGSPDDGDEEDDEWWQKAGRIVGPEIAGQGLGMLVGFREMLGPLQGYEWKGPAGFKVADEAMNLLEQALQMKADKALAKSFIMTQSPFTGLGGVQTYRIIQGWEAAEDEDPETNPLVIGLFGQPPKK